MAKEKSNNPEFDKFYKEFDIFDVNKRYLKDEILISEIQKQDIPQIFSKYKFTSIGLWHPGCPGSDLYDLEEFNNFMNKFEVEKTGKDIAFILITYTRNYEAVKDFIKKYNYPLQVFYLKDDQNILVYKICNFWKVVHEDFYDQYKDDASMLHFAIFKGDQLFFHRSPLDHNAASSEIDSISNQINESLKSDLYIP